MKNEFKTYPTYRSSQFDYIGKLPDHWKEKRVKFLTPKVRTGTTPSANGPDYFTDGNVYWYNPGDFSYESIKLSDSKKKVHDLFFDEKGIKKYPKGSVLIVGIGATLGKVGVSAVEAYSNQQINAILPSDKYFPTYLAYVLFCYTETLKVYSNATTLGIMNQDKTKNFNIPCPEISEQTLIAHFLDQKTSKIDRLIEQKEKLLKLLAEKRTAIITQAVTKGLDPDVEMKDSGVDWLGEIPKEWEVKKFKYEIGFQEGPGIMAVDFELEGVPLLRIRNLKPGGVDLTDCNFLDPEKVEKVWKSYRLKEKDLLISTSATTGLVSEVSKKAQDSIAYTGIIRLRPIDEDRISREFIKLIVSSELFFNQIDLLKTGSTIQHYGPYHLRQIVILRPPLKDQIRITEETNSRIADIDKTIELSKDSIEKLKEYREALITAAVTGQIDVRKEVGDE